MEARAKRRAPAIIKVFSGILRRALPIKGLKSSAVTKKAPTRKPISDSVDPNLER
jgi:hypothetical protein